METTTLRNVALAPTPWTKGQDAFSLAMRQCADYRVHREAVIKSGAKRSPALPMSLLTAARASGMRPDQIAHATGVDPQTVRLALQRNGLDGPVPAQARLASDTPALPIAITAAPRAIPPRRRDQVRCNVPAEERQRLRDEYYAVSEKLRAYGMSFTQIAALSGRAVQSVHQWRVRKPGPYPAPTHEIVDDLRAAAQEHEAVLAKVESLLEKLR
jgi:hypothetical protein